MITTSQITQKLALLNTSNFMSFWKKGGVNYESILNMLAEMGEKKFLKHMNKIRGWNEYDLETLKNDLKHYQNGEPLTNQTDMQGKVKQQPEETKPYQIPKVSPEEEKQVDEEFKSFKPEISTEKIKKNLDNEEQPLYETESIPVRKLSAGDIIPFESLLWCVIKQLNRNFVVIQELYSGRKKRFEIRKQVMIDVLTEDAVNEIVEEFENDKLFDKLPKILQDAFKL